MWTGKIGTFSLGIACIGIGVCVFLASLHVLPWSVLGDVWPLLIVLFGVELILYNYVNPGRRLEWNGMAFAALCVLFVASVSDLVGTRVAKTFTSGVLPWNTRAYMFPVSGKLATDGQIHNVFIRVVNADVLVTGEPGDTARYNGQLSIRGDSQSQAYRTLLSDWQVRKTGNTLDLELRTPKSNAFTFSTGLTRKGTLTVYVPNRLSVTVKTINGTLSIHNTMGYASATTLNGSVHMSKVNQWANAFTLNGQVTLSDVKQRIDARTTNGDILLQQVNGPGSANAVNGSIDASLAKFGGDWSLSTVNGDVRCALPQFATNVAVSADAPHVRFWGAKWHFTSPPDARPKTAYLGKQLHHVQLKTANGSINVDVGPNL